MSEDINVGAISEALNNKADRDLNNTNPLARVVVEVSDKSLMPSWYRVYSDGWCEQGGSATYSSGIANVTFVKKFKDINYNISDAFTTSYGGNGYIYPYTEKTTTGMKLVRQGNSNANISKECDWQAKGYIK